MQLTLVRELVLSMVMLKSLAVDIRPYMQTCVLLGSTVTVCLAVLLIMVACRTCCRVGSMTRMCTLVGAAVAVPTWSIRHSCEWLGPVITWSGLTLKLATCVCLATAVMLQMSSVPSGDRVATKVRLEVCVGFGVVSFVTNKVSSSISRWKLGDTAVPLRPAW